MTLILLLRRVAERWGQWNRAAGWHSGHLHPARWQRRSGSSGAARLRRRWRPALRLELDTTVAATQHDAIELDRLKRPAIELLPFGRAVDVRGLAVLDKNVALARR